LVRQRLIRVSAHIVVVVLAFAAATKCLDLVAFARSLATWDVYHPIVRSALVFFVPLLELSVVAWWCCANRRISAARAALTLLVALTTGYAVQVGFGRVPDCGCMGKILAFRSEMREVLYVVVRNVVLMLMLAPSAFIRGVWPEPSPPATSDSSSSRAPASRTAMTLIETVLVVAMIGLLLALLVPKLGFVRQKAMAIANAANLRTHVQNFTMYANDFRGSTPYFIRPDATYTILRYPDVVAKAQYFDSWFTWHVAVVPGYYGGDYLSKSLRPPRCGPMYAAYYEYACSFVARPEYWNPSTRTGPEQWAPTRLDDVLFASAKVLFHESREEWRGSDPQVSFEQRGHGFGFVDGSAFDARVSEMLAGYPKGDGREPPVSERGHGSQYPPGMHTLDGIRGRDR